MRAAVRGLIWLLPPFLAGAALRLWRLPSQVMGGDELHSVRAMLEMPVVEALTTYRIYDHCIPLTALYRAMVDGGLRLSELAFRAPVVASGLAAAFVLPALAQPLVGRRAARLYAWLFAVSPVLVLYSRIARSYMPIVLLSGLAAAAFYSWLRRGGLLRAAAYTLSAAAAVYFHPVAGPIVLAPVAYALAEHALARTDQRGIKRVLGPLAGVTLAIAAFIVPARTSLVQLIEAKRGGQWVGLDTLAGVAELQAGTTVLPLVLLFWLTAVLGTAVLFRRDARLTAYLLTLLAGHLAGVLVLSPLNFHLAYILNRYLIVTLPIVLILSAAGAIEAAARMTRRPALQATAAGVFVAALVAGGPLVTRHFRDSSFAHHQDIMGFDYPLPRLDDAQIPEFYKRLAGRAAGALIEFPWQWAWKHSRSVYAYETVHGQRVLVSSTDPVFADPRLALRNVVLPDPAAYLASPARYVVVHLDWGAEEDRVRPRPRLPEGSWENARRFWPTQRREGREMTALLMRSWGRPTYSDDRIRAWDLEEVRHRLQAGGGI